MGEAEKILFANEAFYTAFATADLSAMDDLWARENPVSVIHPGAPATLGREAVLASWAEILMGADSFDIECREPAARVFDDVALVLCYERVGTHKLIATNAFVREGGRWLLAHHQSGPSPLLPDAEGKEHRPVH